MYFLLTNMHVSLAFLVINMFLSDEYDVFLSDPSYKLCCSHSHSLFISYVCNMMSLEQLLHIRMYTNNTNTCTQHTHFLHTYITILKITWLVPRCLYYTAGSIVWSYCLFVTGITCDNPMDTASMERNHQFLCGTEMTFECAEGFRLVGSHSLRCLETGNWSNSIPTCEYAPKSMNYSLTHTMYIWLNAMAVSVN